MRKEIDIKPFIVGFFGMCLLIGVVIAFLSHAEPIEPITTGELDPSKAVHASVFQAEDNAVPVPHYWILHECCDCALVHHVLMYMDNGELQMYWWRDQFKTRVQRSHRGFPGTGIVER